MRHGFAQARNPASLLGLQIASTGTRAYHGALSAAQQVVGDVLDGILGAVVRDEPVVGAVEVLWDTSVPRVGGRMRGVSWGVGSASGPTV